MGPEVVDEITRVLIEQAVRERRFAARAMRVDSTVVESDVRWPSDAALALDATRRLAREGARLEGLLGAGAQHVVDRSRAAGKRLRLIGRTVGRRLGRAGGAREQVLKLTGRDGQLVARSIREARRLAAQARAKARGRGAGRKLAAVARLERSAELAETVARQITQRLTGEKITDRLVSLADPDARPIGKGKLGKRYEFGYVFQLAELTPNTRRGARGLILPAASQIGSPNENELLPTTAAELRRLGLRPREVALDGGFSPPASNATLPDSTVFVAGRQQPPTRRPRKRLASYRNGCEGRISHLKRSYGLRRSRLQRTSRRPNLGRLGDPGLQPRHPRHPDHLKISRTAAHPERQLAETAAHPRGRFNFPTHQAPSLSGANTRQELTPRGAPGRSSS